MTTIQQSRWVHPTPYALKDYSSEQLMDRVMWLQDKLDEQHSDIAMLLEQLEKADVIIEHYTGK